MNWIFLGKRHPMEPERRIKPTGKTLLAAGMFCFGILLAGAEGPIWGNIVGILLLFGGLHLME